jgi:hypothetical protein
MLRIADIFVLFTALHLRKKLFVGFHSVEEFTAAFLAVELDVLERFRIQMTFLWSPNVFDD